MGHDAQLRFLIAATVAGLPPLIVDSARGHRQANWRHSNLKATAASRGLRLWDRRWVGRSKCESAPRSRTSPDNAVLRLVWTQSGRKSNLSATSAQCGAG